MIDPSERQRSARRKADAEQLGRFDEIAAGLRSALVDLWVHDPGGGKDLVLDVVEGPFSEAKLNRTGGQVTSVQLRAASGRAAEYDLGELGRVGTVLIYFEV